MKHLVWLKGRHIGHRDMVSVGTGQGGEAVVYQKTFEIEGVCVASSF